MMPHFITRNLTHCIHQNLKLKLTSFPEKKKFNDEDMFHEMVSYNAFTMCKQSNEADIHNMTTTCQLHVPN